MPAKKPSGPAGVLSKKIEVAGITVPVWVILAGVGLYLWHTGALAGLLGTQAPQQAQVPQDPQAAPSGSHHHKRGKGGRFGPPQGG